MSSDREALSEQSSSVCEGTSYDEVYPLGCGPKEGLTWSLERELSAHSLDEGEEEEYEKKEGEYDGGEEGKYEEGEEQEVEEEEESEEGSQERSDGMVGKVKGSSSRPFILLKICRIRSLAPSMTATNLIAFPSVYRGNLKGVIRGRRRTLTCTMPCLLLD